MPSFLSKVLRRKRDAGESSSSPQSAKGPELLGGKFEDVSPTVSPSMANFPELKGQADFRGRNQEKKSANGTGSRTLFRSKSRPRSPTKQAAEEEAPKLPLNLLGEVQGLDESAPEMSEAAIGMQRLTPVEALGLVRTCSQIITARGLDTLGIMHPHWHSASPDVQHTLITLFLHSLTSKSPISSSAFDLEINSMRSPHDVAAVLRWGLRHLSLLQGGGGDPDSWYNSFFDAERKAEFPPKAFSDILAPLVPGPQYELLKEVLELFSSLASHAEWNSTSGSKLSKVFGLWLLNSHRVENQEDWKTFYERWETAGRQLEHLFFAYIRNEGADHQIPRRLAELVQKYPYYLPSPSTDLHLLPRPKFTTRLHEALFIRVETELPNETLRPTRKIHPLRVVAEALSSSSSATDESQTDLAAVWAKIIEASKEGGSTTGGSSPLARIFSDDTIRFLTMVPDDTDAPDNIHSPVTIGAFLPPSPDGKGKRLSFSLSRFTDEFMMSRANSQQSQSLSPGTEHETPLSASTTDWSVFSSAGFSATTPLTPLASTLFSNDVERTSPSHSRKPSRRGIGQSPSSTSILRKSVEFKDEPSPSAAASSDGHKTGTDGKGKEAEHEHDDGEDTIKLTSTLASFQIVQMDEAFIDFWSDALLDPVSSTWPSFVVCKIRPSVASGLSYGVQVASKEGEDIQEENKKTVEWVVLEQVFVVKPPPTPPQPVAAPVRTASPIPAPTTAEKEERERAQERPSSPSSAAAGKKRFAFWSTSRTSSVTSVLSLSKTKKEKEKEGSGSRRIGEMGELIEEGEAGDGKEKESRRRSFSGTFMKKDKDVSGKDKKEKQKEKERREKERKAKEKDVVKVRVPSPKPRKSVDVPRKSIDAGLTSKAVAASALTPTPAADRKDVDPVNVPLPEDSQLDQEKPVVEAQEAPVKDITTNKEAPVEAKSQDAPIESTWREIPVEVSEPSANGQVAPISADETKASEGGITTGVVAGVVGAAATAVLPILQKDAAPDEAQAAEGADAAKELETGAEVEALKEEVQELVPVLAVIEDEVKKEEEVKEDAAHEGVVRVDGTKKDEESRGMEEVGQDPVEEVKEEAKVDDIIAPAVRDEAKEKESNLPVTQEEPQEDEAVIPIVEAVEEGPSAPLGEVKDEHHSVASALSMETKQEVTPSAVDEEVPKEASPPTATANSQAALSAVRTTEGEIVQNPEFIAEAGVGEPTQNLLEGALPTGEEHQDAPHALEESSVLAPAMLAETEDAIATTVQELEASTDTKEVVEPVDADAAEPKNPALAESIPVELTTQAVLTGVPPATEEPADVKELAPAPSIDAEAQPQESAAETLVRETIETSDARHAGDAIETIVQAAVDAKDEEIEAALHGHGNEVSLEEEPFPGPESEVKSSTGGPSESTLESEPAKHTVTSSDDLLSPASTITPTQFNSMQTEDIHHDSFEEIVHPIVDVDKVVTPPAVVEAATNKGLFEEQHAEDQSAPQIDIIHQIVPVEKVHTPPEIVEAAQEQGGTAPSSKVGTPSVVEVTQEEAQLTLPPTENVVAPERAEVITDASREQDAPGSPSQDARAHDQILASESPIVQDLKEAEFRPTAQEGVSLAGQDDGVPIVVENLGGADPEATVASSLAPTSKERDAQDQAYAHVSDIKVEPKPPVDDAVVADEVATAEEGVFQVEQEAGIPIMVEDPLVVESVLEDEKASPSTIQPLPRSEEEPQGEDGPQHHDDTSLEDDEKEVDAAAQPNEQATVTAVGSVGDVIASVANVDETLSPSVDDTTTMTKPSQSTQPETPLPSSPVVNIASATPRIAPLNLGAESPGDMNVDLPPVPLTDIPVLPPASSASAAFPDLLKPLYETVPVEALSPREEVSSFSLPDHPPESSNAHSSDSAKAGETQQHESELASNLATAAATSDLPSAIEHIVQSGLTPSAEALLDAVQESLIGAMRDEGASPDKPLSPVLTGVTSDPRKAPESLDEPDVVLPSSSITDSEAAPSIKTPEEDRVISTTMSQNPDNSSTSGAGKKANDNQEPPASDSQS